MKNTTIMPSRVHISASHPAGRENRPKAKKPRCRHKRSVRHSSCPIRGASTSATAVAKISMNRWSRKWPMFSSRKWARDRVLMRAPCRHLFATACPRCRDPRQRIHGIPVQTLALPGPPPITSFPRRFPDMPSTTWEDTPMGYEKLELLIDGQVPRRFGAGKTWKRSSTPRPRKP